MGGLHVSDDEIHEEMVKLFLQPKLDVLAAEFLVSRDANINHLDRTGSGAIHYSTKTSNQNHLSFLQSNKANMHLPDKFGNTPLHYAVLLNDLRLADFFLSITTPTSISINVCNNDGLTPVHFSSQTIFMEEQLEWLQSKGANFGARTVSGWRPIDYAIQRVRDDNVDVDAAKKKLVGLGLPGSVEGIGIKGKKNLELNEELVRTQTMARRRRGAISALNSVGAGVNDDLDPFSWREDSLNAPLKERPRTPRLGGDFGKRRNALEGAEHVQWQSLRKLWWHDDPPTGPVPLPQVIEAARLGQKELAKHLLKRSQHEKHPDKLEARNNLDRTALLYAVTHGHTEIAKTLMEAGADPFDYKGKIKKWEAEMEFDKKKRAVRRAARDEKSRRKLKKELEEIEKLKRKEEEKKRTEKIRWNIRYGSDHAVTMRKQLELHPNIFDLSDNLKNELTSRVARIEQELVTDPFHFLATQEIVVIDKHLERLQQRMEGNGTGCSPYSLHSDPSWPPVVKFGIPNLGWRVREIRRVLGHLSASHCVSKGQKDFTKMESEGTPIVRRRKKGERRLIEEEEKEGNDDEDSSDDEGTMTNVMLDLM